MKYELNQNVDYLRFNWYTQNKIYKETNTVVNEKIANTSAKLKLYYMSWISNEIY